MTAQNNKFTAILRSLVNFLPAIDNGSDIAHTDAMMQARHFVRSHSLSFSSLRLLICAVIFVGLPASQANFVTLIWNPSVDSNVAGYKIYYGVTSGLYTNTIDVGNVTNVTISGLAPYTTYFFAAKSYDSYGVLSDFSNETKLMVYPPATVSPTSNVPGQITFKILGGVNVVSAVTNVISSVTNVVPGVTNYYNVLYAVQASTDLIHWVAIQTNVAPFTFVDPNASEFSHRFYRTINIASPVADSMPVFAPKPFVNGQLTFNVPGITNVPLQYVVQASTDLENWVSLQTNTSPFVFVDTNANQFSQRFYRTFYLPQP